jgi:hypothetical protein
MLIEQMAQENPGWGSSGSRVNCSAWGTKSSIYGAAVELVEAGPRRKCL